MPQQSLEFSDLGDIVQTTVDQGVSLAVLQSVQTLIECQITAGHPVTVWNRTPSCADELVAEGATLAASAKAAIRAAEIAVLSLTDYQSPAA